MLKALVLKELRELAPIAAIALAVYAFLVANRTGVEFIFWTSGNSNDIPFVSDGFTEPFILVSLAFGLALAMKQTLGESWRATWLWLLFRPVSRGEMIMVKLATGLSLYLVCSALPIVWYSCWAALPAKHASPFYWSMTVETWEAWFITGTLYLAAFWCGLWPARSLGPRWMPFVGTGIMIFAGCGLLSLISSTAVWLIPVAFAGLIASNILFVTRTRDFS